MRIEKLSAPASFIGESPIWDTTSERLFWIDGLAGKVYAAQPGAETFSSWDIGERIGSIAFTKPDGLLLALRHGFYHLNLQTSAITPMCSVPQTNPVVSLNDGKMDRGGRFVCAEWVTTYKALGCVYRYTSPNRIETLLTGVRIGNGICFSPSGDRMYFTDSITKKILVFSYGHAQPLGQPKTFFDTSSLNSSPDGATVDQDGNVWAALVHVGKIARISPSGKLDDLIDVPVDYPSSVSFGGADFSTLFVTSIKDSGTGHTVSKHPDGGGVFAISDLGVRGLPEAALSAGTDTP